MLSTKAPNLTTRDLAVITTTARYKFLSSHQLKAQHFPESTHDNATKRMTQLAKAGFLSRVFAYPKAIDDPKGGHPTAIYYMSPTNLKILNLYFQSKAQVHRFDDFQNLPTTDNHEEAFAPQYLWHELGISDFFLALEASASKHNLTIPFWERTSPFSKEITTSRIITAQITKKISGRSTTTTEQLPFNPDGFFSLQDRDGFYTFYFIEYDNNSSSPEKFRKKLMGYLAYAEQKRFPQLLDYYKTKYALPIHHTDKAGFRVLTITPNERRRDALFLDSLTLRSFTRFLFASITDTIPDKTLTAVWMRGKEYPVVAEQLKQLPPQTSHAIQSRTLTELLATMPRVSLTN